MTQALPPPEAPPDGGPPPSGRPPAAVGVPSVSLPKPGGAIRGIGEKFETNPVTGTGALSVPIVTSPGRSGFGPSLALTYDSGRGNGVFGFGWTLSLPSITRRTDKGLPRYDDTDVFLFSDAEDLVPARDGTAGWARMTTTTGGYRVDRYRPRIEGLYARIERWTRLVDGDTHWRVTTPDNLTSWYGLDGDSRIADPVDPGKVFSWLICRSQDDRGNAMVFTYARENEAGVDTSLAHERHRTAADRQANRYLKSIRYGNRVSHLTDPQLADPAWMFEVVLDYGEHDPDAPSATPSGTWPCREDPFSSYRSGFEVRTYRRCQRILMVHHFPDEAGVGADCVVRSTELTYHSAGAVGALVTGVTVRGWKRTGNGYTRRALPSLEFDYSPATLHDEVREVDAESLIGAPAGLATRTAQWVDLDGEGVPGMLIEQGKGWFYKANLGGARFAPARVLSPVPSLVGAGRGAMAGNAQLLDLAGDGELDLAVFAGSAPGFFERTPGGGWARFTPFASMPTVDWADQNLRFVDLDGDGHADILLTEADALRWYPARGEAGFGPANRVSASLDESEGPRLIFADGTGSVHLADMSGDGLADLVRIRDGEVSYWPNLGHGRFGRRVTMDGAPRYGRNEEFDPRRLRMADVDGSGVTDILYLTADGVTVYLNRSGNSFAEGVQLRGTPSAVDPATVSTVDLQGTGTACVVWSSPSSGDDRRSMRYVDLMGGHKPHLMVGVANNFGAHTTVEYGSSAGFLLADKAAGRPWRTKLPFPVQVVTRVELHDRITGNRVVSRYAYRHGHFDGVEREFRGFGLVERWDAEEVVAEAGVEALPPVWTRTWYHTGALDRLGRTSRQYAEEYWAEPGLTDSQRASLLLDDTVWPAGLQLPDGTLTAYAPSADEIREACRALRGAVLRQEVYALDGSAAQDRPYHVTERSYAIDLLQPRRDGDPHAVCALRPRETVVYDYERALCQPGGTGPWVADPRVSHELVLDTDAWGNVRRAASVAYGRRYPGEGVDAALPGWAASAVTDEQTRPRAMLTRHDYTVAVETVEAYRAPVRWQTRGYELLGLPSAPLLRLADLRDLLEAGVPELAYEDSGGATGPGVSLRLVGQEVSLFRADDLTGPLPAGQSGSRALAHESYTLAFSSGLLSTVYDGLVADVTGLLSAEGGYVVREGFWWIPSGRLFLSGSGSDPPAAELVTARAHFFQPVRAVDAFGNATLASYDADDLLVTGGLDAVGNQIQADIDYRVLQPWRVTDANGTRTSVLFDALGMVVATAVEGRIGDPVGDSLEGVQADPPEPSVAAYLADPVTVGPAMLGQATSRIVYDAFAYARTRDDPQPQPTVVAALDREVHGGESPVNHELVYTDGLSRQVQTKAQAEDHRWVGSGWVVLNNKGLPVRRYEPFFTATHAYEHAVADGVSAVLCYDPRGRVVATLYPDATYDKMLRQPWRQVAWDAADTVLLDPRTDPDVRAVATSYVDSLPPGWQTWHAQRIGGVLGGPAQLAAAATAGTCAGTPTVGYLDPLGRTVVTADHNRTGATDELLPTRAVIDIEGNRTALVDPTGRTAGSSTVDIAGRLVRETSTDEGVHVLLPDASGAVLRSVDARGCVLRNTYDALRRPVRRYARGSADDAEWLVQRTVWGEAHPDPTAAYLRTRVLHQFDGAGLSTVEEYDFKGNPVRTSRRLAAPWDAAVDWSALDGFSDAQLAGAVPGGLLETEQHTTVVEVDARGRPTQVEHPDGGAVRYAYNETGLLERVDTRTAGESNWTPVVAGVSYTAHAQRAELRYGNGAQTTYTHDPLTRRLVAATTVGADGVVQDLGYIYDAVGNITHLRDAAQQTVFYAGAVVEPHASYEYDALYRLVGAAGREHAGQQVEPAPSWSDAGRTGLPHPHDGQAMRRYTQAYGYDLVGNLTRMVHQAGGTGWTRTYQYSGPQLDNRLTGTQVGAGPTEPYQYNECGDIIAMPHLPLLGWDHQRRLALADRGGGGRAHYRYDAAGSRVRRTLARPNGTRASERIYLGGCELYREYDGTGETIELRRSTVHLTDGVRRIALMEVRHSGTDAAPARLLRFTLDNHLDSAAVELDAAGQVLTYEEYYPFGATSFASFRGSSAPPPKRYRFGGKERDSETGLYYHGARYYAPWLGRWISPDPAGVRPGELSGYVFCLNRPVILVDPDGGNPGVGTHVPNPAPVRPPPIVFPTQPPPAPPPVSPPPVVVNPPPAPTPGPGPTAGIGRWLLSTIFAPVVVAVAVGTIIVATPTNAFDDDEYPYTDPDTGKTMTFKSFEDREIYKEDRAREKREAPGATDKPKDATLPGDPGKKGPAITPSDPNKKGPAQLPGKDDPTEKKEAPGALDPVEVEAGSYRPDQPLTDPEKAAVMKQLKAGKPLTTEQKGWLRAEARWMWRNMTKGKGPQPKPGEDGWQVHHIIPLEYSHLLPELYPNMPTNLMLIPTQYHIELHTLLNKEIGKIPLIQLPNSLKDMQKNMRTPEGRKTWRGRTIWSP